MIQTSAIRLMLLLISLSLAGCFGDKQNTQPDATPEANTAASPGPVTRPPAHSVYRGKDGFMQQTIDGWAVSCKKDPIDNSKYCQSNKSNLSVGVLLDRSGGLIHQVTIHGVNTYPGGGEWALQLDADPLLQATSKGFDDATSRQIISRLQTATQAMTRYRTRTQGYEEKIIAVGRFQEVVNYMNNALQTL